MRLKTYGEYPDNWLMRRPYAKTTAGLKRLARQDARWAMVLMGLAA